MTEGRFEVHRARVLEVYTRMQRVGAKHGVKIAQTVEERATMFRVIGLVAGWMTMTEEVRGEIELEDADIMLAMSVAIHVMSEIHFEYAQAMEAS